MKKNSVNGTSKWLLLILLILPVFALLGCETSEDRQIASAESCLDSATTTADADRCISLVSGLTSADSYLIRCSANFIANGFTGTRLANAFQSVKDNKSGTSTDPTKTMMAYMVFTDTSDNHNINQVVSNCQASGVSSMYRLAVAAQLATSIASLGNQLTAITNLGSNPTQAQLETAITSAITAVQSGGAASQTTIGTIAISAQTAFCGTGSAYSTTTVCTDLNSAVAANGGSAQAIGAQLLTLLQTPN